MGLEFWVYALSSFKKKIIIIIISVRQLIFPSIRQYIFIFLFLTWRFNFKIKFTVVWTCPHKECYDRWNSSNVKVSNHLCRLLLCSLLYWNWSHAPTLGENAQRLCPKKRWKVRKVKPACGRRQHFANNSYTVILQSTTTAINHRIYKPMHTSSIQTNDITQFILFFNIRPPYFLRHVRVEQCALM